MSDDARPGVDRDPDVSDDARPGSTTLAAVLFVLGIVGGLVFVVGFVVVEGVGAQTRVLGSGLALALLGIGGGLVVWAKALMPQGPDVEERTPPGAGRTERRAAAQEAEQRGQRVGRRGLLGSLLAGALGATGLAALLPARSLAPDPFPQRLTTGWARGVRVVDREGTPLRVDDLDVGSALPAFPASREHPTYDAQVMLIRLAPGLLDDAPQGLVAYSRVCTHLGCAVGLYQTEEHRLLCPCHQSSFDVLDGAQPSFGPATRPLPRLPLEVDADGFIVAARGFDRPVGPGFWTFPSRDGDVERES